jgi:hypothetical protein
VRVRNLIPYAVLLGLFAALPIGLSTAADGRANRPDVLSVDQVKPGMKGYGLTVFEGTKPQKFDVEVIDVLRNFRPRQDLILVKTTHPRLEVAKVVAGMSGSPIFLDGKMAGAYAYGWSFGAEPIAGVTPIRSMLDDLERPVPRVLYGWPLFPGAKATSKKTAALTGNPGGHRYAGSPLDYDLERHRDQIERKTASSSPGVEVSPVRPVSTPLLLGGMTPSAIAVAHDLMAPLGLEPMQAGGGGEGISPDAPYRYENGGAVGVQLVRGDMSAMGLGTVTRVEGDLVSGFGHPMMNAGQTALPTAIGEVLWFLASQSRSFKIGMPARPVGALVNDRQASIVVSHEARAPVIPVSVKVNGAPGAPYTDWNFEVAHEKFMAPTFLALALGSALETTASERQDVTWTITSKVRFKNHGEVLIEDFGVAIGGTPEVRDIARSNLVGAVGAVLSNPWEPAFVESVDIDVKLSYSRDIYRLRGVEVLDAEVEPGEPARARLTFVRFAGPPVHRTVKIPLGRHLAGQTLKIDVQPGYMVEKEKAPPENLADLIEALQDPIYPPRSLVLSFKSGTGMAHKGQVADNLPAGVVDLISPTSTTVGPREFQAQTHHVVPMPAFVLGADKLSVQVKSILR